MGDTIKVKFVRSVLRGGKDVPVGTVLELPEKEANLVIGMKKAVPAPEKDVEEAKGGNKK